MKEDDNGADFKLDSRLDRRLRRKHVFWRNVGTIRSCGRSKGSKEAGKVRDIGIGKGGGSEDEEYEKYLNGRVMSLTSSKQCNPLDKDDDDVVFLGEEDGTDSEYKSFFDYIRKDGNTLLYEGPSIDGVLKVLRIEEEEEDDVSDSVNEGSPADCNDGKTGSAVRNLGSVKGFEKDKAEAKHLNSRQWSVNSSRHEGSHNMVSDFDSDFDAIDDNYGEFLDCMKTDGEHLVVMLKSGKEITLSEDDDSSSDSEVLVVDPFCGGCYTPFVPSKEYANMPGEKNWEDTKTPCWSPFRENLMDLLKKPFCQSEFDDLWEELNRKKPIEVHREGHDGRVIKRIINTSGKSYLDDHGDFLKVIDSAKRNRFKKLSLLRGFFYWLQNRPQVGSFKPWLDSAFLEAI